MLQGKNIVLGVTGGIAAYKAAYTLRLLMKEGANVDIIMTKSATEFIGPLTLQTLSGNPVHIDQFNLIEKSEIGHISLADRADLFLLCPATANIMGKVANGIADDLLTTSIMATKAPVLFAPAMNSNMWESPAMQANLKKLREYGYHIIEPQSGELACHWIGKGRLSEPEQIVFKALEIISGRPLLGKSIVVTAGPTCEPIDPVRFISNKSSGKMGYALARAAKILGANVTLISGPVSSGLECYADEVMKIDTALDMLKATKKSVRKADALIMCAAVADFRPESFNSEKVSKDRIDKNLKLKKNLDIIGSLSKNKGDRIFVGFAAQTKELLKNARKKLNEKNLDFIVANDVSRGDIGFNSDENEVTILSLKGTKRKLSKKSKDKIAFEILYHIFNIK